MTVTTMTVTVATTPSNTNGSDKWETDDIFSKLFTCVTVEKSLNTAGGVVKIIRYICSLWC